MCVFMLVRPGLFFSRCAPPAPPPPGLLNVAVSLTLAHSWESGHLLLADMLASLGLETAGSQLPVPSSQSSFLLSMASPAGGAAWE